MSGELTFRGTRVLVRALFDYLEAGYELERFLEGFPTSRINSMSAHERFQWLFFGDDRQILTISSVYYQLFSRRLAT